MWDIYQSIINIFIDLSARGINLISIALTIFLVHILKTIFNNFEFYNKITGSLINLIIGFIISLGFSLLFYLTAFRVIKDLHFNIILTTIIGGGLAVYSREIIDAVLKIIQKKTS